MSGGKWLGFPQGYLYEHVPHKTPNIASCTYCSEVCQSHGWCTCCLGNGLREAVDDPTAHVEELLKAKN